jgi:outer membrane protein assembly factor BamB
MSRLALFAVVASVLAVPLGAAPVPKGPPPPPLWGMLGGTPARNMVNLHDKLPSLPDAGPDWNDDAAVRKWEAQWVIWKADLGSRSYGGPVVADGRVYVGTNNERPRNRRDTRNDQFGAVEPVDKGILMCFEENTGKFLWQAVHDKLPNGNVTDWPKEGLCSTPAIVGDRVFYVSNQCRVVCADVNGFANGNQGFQHEQYQDATDADIIWEYDMIRELNVFPHNMSNCSPLVVGDCVFVCTSNGVDESHTNIPSPDAPALICLHRTTGKLLWKDASPGKNLMHGQWSSPTYATDPIPQVLHAQGDGWLRSFDPATGKLLWKFDCNRKGAVYELGGTGDKSDFIAMPVVHSGRVYIGTGQDPEHSTGIAHLWCIDLKKAVELGAKEKNRDVSPDFLAGVEQQPGGQQQVLTRPNPSSALAWVYGGEEARPFAPRDFKFGRTMSTVAVVGNVLYAAELHGNLQCLNAKTGDVYWQYDTRASIWNSPYFVDGKVFVGTDAGDLFVFRHDPQPDVIDYLGGGAGNRAGARQAQKAARQQVEKRYLLAKIEMPAAIRTTSVAANGMLFVATENVLCAIKAKN